MTTVEISKHNICGFFNKDLSGYTISQLKICDRMDFRLEDEPTYKEKERMSLIKKLDTLPSTVVWIVCEIVHMSEDRTIVIRPGLSNNEEIQGLKEDMTDIDYQTNRKIVYVNLADIKDLELPFMPRKSSSGVIGIAYIQIKMLRTALMTDKPLGMLLATNMFHGISDKLTKKQADVLRFLSPEVKRTVDSFRKQTIFYLTMDYDYGSIVELRRLWTQHNKKPEDCTIDLYFFMENDEEGNLRFTRGIDALIQSNAKISARFYIPDTLEGTEQQIYDFLFTTINRLQNIVSLEIDFVNRNFFATSFTRHNVNMILSRLPFLSSLHIKNVIISLLPFFDCVKQIRNLTELRLSGVDLTFCLIEEEERPPYNQDEFIRIVSDFLRGSNIRTIGLHTDYNCCLIDDEYLIDEIALILEKITTVTSFDVSNNDMYEEPTYFRERFIIRMINLKHLKEFNISNNNLGVAGLTDILPMIRSLPNLEILNLSNNGFPLDAIMLQGGLIPALRGLRKLKKLYIQDRLLSEADIRDVQLALPGIKVL
jgi:hypothetical protein